MMLPGRDRCHGEKISGGFATQDAAAALEALASSAAGPEPGLSTREWLSRWLASRVSLRVDQSRLRRAHAVLSGPVPGLGHSSVVLTADTYLSVAVELGLKAAAAAARLVLNAGKSPPGGGSVRRRSAPVLAEITA